MQVLNQQNKQEVQNPPAKIPWLIKFIFFLQFWPILLFIILIPFNINNPSFWNPAAIPLLPIVIIFVAIYIFAFIQTLKFKKIGWILLVILSIPSIFSITGLISILILLKYRTLYFKKTNA